MIRSVLALTSLFISSRLKKSLRNRVFVSLLTLYSSRYGPSGTEGHNGRAKSGLSGFANVSDSGMLGLQFFESLASSDFCLCTENVILLLTVLVVPVVPVVLVVVSEFDECTEFGSGETVSVFSYLLACKIVNKSGLHRNRWKNTE